MITLFQVVNGLRALPLLGNLVKNKRLLSQQGGANIWRSHHYFWQPLKIFGNLRLCSEVVK